MKPITLNIPREDVGDYGNALNEVLHGLAIPDFDRRIGSRVDAERLMRYISDAYRASREDQDLLIQLEPAQAHILRSALTVVLDALDADEFQTRMGCASLHARELLARLARL